MTTTTTHRITALASGVLEWLEDNELDVYNMTLHIADTLSMVTMHVREANTRLVIADTLSALANVPLEEVRSGDHTSHRGSLTDAFGTVGRVDVTVIGPPSPAACPTCQGTGHIEARPRGLGPKSSAAVAPVDVVCPVCDGTGTKK